jgi:2-polyprenyl-6-hydroxyphenyl methylase/3-demethylubiquinone-9 3-methyltransferase
MRMTSDAESASGPAVQGSAAGIVAGSAYHEDLAGSWSDRYESGAFGRRRAFILAEMADLDFLGRRWVDAGCGSGVFSRELIHRGAEVIGVDASPAMIASAQSAPAPEGGGAVYQLVQSVDTLPFADAAVYGVVCLSVLEYVDSPRETIRELARVLEPGGCVVLTVPNAFSVLRRGQQLIRRAAGIFGKDVWGYLSVSRHGFSRRQCVAEMNAAGLAVVRITGFSPYWQRLLSPIGIGGLWVVVARKR